MRMTQFIRYFLRQTFLLMMSTTILGLLPSQFGFAADKKPNIVFFLVDDLGWSDLGCYGNRFHETPTIDRFAKQGMLFTDAYAACPVCSPTRASIMTGKYPATLNLTDFIPGHWRPWAKLIVPKFNQQLPYKEITIAEALKPLGYTSGAFGKWHLGGRRFFPDSQGFDEFLVTSGRHFAPNFRTIPRMKVPKGQYLADTLTDRAERFLETNKDKPFFLYLSHYAVHIPLEAKDELVEKYRQKKKPATGVNHPVYAAMVEHVDRSFARILKKLDELKLSDNTVVIFFSDNGGLRKRFDDQGPIVTSNAPLRDEKGSLYEGGIRVPAIIRWPGKVKADIKNSTPVCSIDFFPTILEIAQGSKNSKASNSDVDGKSLLPVLVGSSNIERTALYWHYPHYHHTSPAGAIRAGDFKLIEYFEDGKLELYNLKSDFGETRNLADSLPRKTAELHELLNKWRKQVDAKMPTVNPKHNPAKAQLWGRRSRKKKRRK